MYPFSFIEIFSLGFLYYNVSEWSKFSHLASSEAGKYRFLAGLMYPAIYQSSITKAKRKVGIKIGNDPLSQVNL